MRLGREGRLNGKSQRGSETWDVVFGQGNEGSRILQGPPHLPELPLKLRTRTTWRANAQWDEENVSYDDQYEEAFFITSNLPSDRHPSPNLHSPQVRFSLHANKDHRRIQRRQSNVELQKTVSSKLYVMGKLGLTMKSKDGEGSELSENGKRPLEGAAPITSVKKSRPNKENKETGQGLYSHHIWHKKTIHSLQTSISHARCCLATIQNALLERKKECVRVESVNQRLEVSYRRTTNADGAEHEQRKITNSRISSFSFLISSSWNLRCSWTPAVPGGESSSESINTDTSIFFKRTYKKMR